MYWPPANLSLMDLIEISLPGVPVMAQWLTNQLGTMRLRVRSLALLSGSRIRHCCVSGVGQQLQLQLDPWPGNLHMPQERPKKWPKDKKKKRKEKVSYTLRRLQ